MITPIQPTHPMSENIEHTKGIISALVTPFTEDGAVNEDSLRKITRHSIELQVRAFYVCGTTGEGMLMSPSERKRVVEIVCEEAAGEAGVIVNISDQNFLIARELAAHAAYAGADAVSTLPPLYYPISDEERTRYYLELLDAAELPLTLYNIPMLTGIALNESTAARLARHPRFLGIKHSSEDTAMLARFKEIEDGRLLVWMARDAYYLSGLAMGADGAIGSSFNLMGDLFVGVTNLYQEGDVANAQVLQNKINQVHRRLQVFGPIKSIKRCFTLMGIDAGDCRLPYQPLPAEADAHLIETLALLDSVRQEFPTARTASKEGSLV